MEALVDGIRCLSLVPIILAMSSFVILLGEAGLPIKALKH